MLNTGNLTREMFERAGLVVSDKPRQPSAKPVSAAEAVPTTETPAVADVVPTEVMSVEPVADATPKMSGSGPTHKSDVIRAGAIALANQEAAHDWTAQKQIAKGLSILRADAMAEAKTNTPKGRRYCEALSRLLRLYGYDRLDKSDRAKYFKIASDFAAIEAWRDADPKRARLNYGPSVWDAYQRSLAASSGDDDGDDAQSAPTLVGRWPHAPAAERTKLFDTVPLEEQRAAWSPAFAAKLIGMIRVKALQADPDRAFSNALQAALGYLAAADQPGEDANKTQAIAALRGMASMLRGLGLKATDLMAGILTPARAKVLEKKKNRRRHC
jgi:hypothetical protein